MISRTILILFLCHLTLGEEGVRRPWSVATWNLQNYLVQNRYEEGQFRFSYPMPEDRKSRIRNLILSEKPDILLLQELGDAAFLLELQLDLKAEGLAYPYFQFSGKPDARSGLGFLSRIAPVECIFHELSLKRGLQELRFELDGTQFRFFHVHLKSRYTDDPDDPESMRVRKQEIADLSSFVSELCSLDKSSRMILAGDFNTPFEDPLMSPLREGFSPIPSFDENGSSATYFHKSGSKELLDGFWFPFMPDALPKLDSRILPGPDICPSDHRMVVLRL